MNKDKLKCSIHYHDFYRVEDSHYEGDLWRCSGCGMYILVYGGWRLIRVIRKDMIYDIDRDIQDRIRSRL